MFAFTIHLYQLDDVIIRKNCELLVSQKLNKSKIYNKIDGDGENFSSSLFYFLTYNVPGITIYLTIRLNVK